jgi:hypothetical protein
MHSTVHPYVHPYLHGQKGYYEPERLSVLMPPFWEISDYEVSTHEPYRDLHIKKEEKEGLRSMRRREGQEV